MAVEGTNEATGNIDEEGINEDDVKVMAAIDDEDEVLCGPCEPNEDELEDVQPHKKVRNPHAPSKQEILEHRVLHWPYRSWCRACVFGRGKHTHHLKSKEPRADRELPSINIDFMFLATHEIPAKKKRNVGYV